MAWVAYLPVHLCLFYLSVCQSHLSIGLCVSYLFVHYGAKQAKICDEFLNGLGHVQTLNPQPLSIMCFATLIINDSQH